MEPLDEESRLRIVLVRVEALGRNVFDTLVVVQALKQLTKAKQLLELVSQR
jgi:alkyl hydroperoxide reductase subunit AhpC